MSVHRFVRVAIDVPVAATPQSAGDDGLFDYRVADPSIRAGDLVLVPFGRRNVLGIVLAVSDTTTVDVDRIRDVLAIVDGLSALSADWIALTRFAARYYHRGIGESMIPSLPSPLRAAASFAVSAATDGSTARATLPAIARAVKRAAKAPKPPPQPPAVVTLNAMQDAALNDILAAREEPTPKPRLLYGITGSGKTEVYLRAVAEAVGAGRQALVLVPEINLTPQLVEAVRRRLPDARVASLHSGVAAGQRLHQWVIAHEGDVDVLLGTRLAILASLPRLGLIVVDEEHDTSYKQHEGLRYSARDLAVMRAFQGTGGRSFPVVLASATPSLETWAHAASGRYRKLVLSERAVEAATLPQIRLVPTLRVPAEHGITPTVRDAIADRIARGEPTLVFHNRRGYAPVLVCGACGWLSDCPRCSVHAVFHKADRRLHCHHCGWYRAVPRACPDCGNVDLSSVGRGTQRVEESLRTLFPDARVARIDRDSTRRKGAAARLIDAVHQSEVDLLVGTQMLAKGHDFRNVTLVCVLDADTALYSHDFRAAERLFANLMQVAGRAGRGGAQSARAEVLIQTRAPDHPLFAALLAHDFERFAAGQLDERRAAGLPPFSYQAVVRAEAAADYDALQFLAEARAVGARLLEADAVDRGIALYDPVAMAVARVANVERAQLLVESTERPALHAFLDQWLPVLPAIRSKVRWHVEVDPLDL